jgi:hypothetical protein
MKLTVILGFSALFALGAGAMPIHAAQVLIVSDQMVEHGGGCRKSSPPGQCCHMDRKAGSVHCH